MLNSEKFFYNIAEVSKRTELPAYILRFWEQKFSQINPRKNKNRRYYREEDIKIINIIKFLLYDKGYTIKGVQKYLQEFSDKELTNYDMAGMEKDKEDGKKQKNSSLPNVKLNIEEMEILLEKLLTLKQSLSNLKNRE